jgi:RNA polymerase sigma factor (sigma-70 family)
MEQLLRRNWRQARRLAFREAKKWHIPNRDWEDIWQDTLVRVLRYHKDAPASRDPNLYFLGGVRLNARTVAMRKMGYHNGDKRPQSPQARGESLTNLAGLFQTDEEDDDRMLVDERIMQTVPSAEDAYMATLPNKREVALREAMERLPELQRTVLTHQFYEELSVAESACVLGISRTQVSLARSAGMRKLRDEMKPKRKVAQSV